MNPETLRDVANVVLIIGLITAACGTFGVNYFRGQVEKSRAIAAKGKEQQSDERATTLQNKVNELVSGKDELLKQNAGLMELVEARNARIQELNNALEATKRYSYVATLTFNGMVYTGGDVTMPTPISQAVEGTWHQVAPNRFRPVCDEEALQKSRKAIEQFPDFPFTYYALAYCLERQGSAEWRSYAKKAVAIFEQTTSIGGHQKSHDEMLAYLRQQLSK